jgi:uncharacterized protein involved in response to NO
MKLSLKNDPDSQPIFLSIGFRPFFLVAGIQAVFAMFAWITWLMLHSVNAVILQPTISVPAHLWHGHEMVFGFAAAVIAGLLMTAVPGWTGTRRVAGFQLLLLLVLWLIGRMAMWFSSFVPAIVVALADMSFLPLLAVAIAYALMRQPQVRNSIFLVLIIVLIVTNGLMHAEWLGWTDDTASWALTVAILNIVLMITLLAGRIVPSFTRNAMIRKQQLDNHPKQIAMLDRVSIGAVAAVLVLQILSVPDPVLGAAAVVAGLVNLLRQALWRPDWVVGEPILWSLHLAYLWIPIGMFSLAGAIFFDFPTQGGAMHVFGIGVIGGMTLAMMTRAPLGHTGRPLVVRSSIALAYVLIALAAIVRGFLLDMLPGGYFQVVLAAGVLWMTGFAIFAATYLPILLGPSLKTQAAD